MSQDKTHSNRFTFSYGSPGRRDQQIAQPTPFSLRYGVYSIKGKRPTMEDAHTAIGEIGELLKNEYNEKQIEHLERTAFFGVFDGHCGVKASRFCSQNLHKLIIKSEYFPIDIKRAIKDAFEKLEEMILKISEKYQLSDGTTATIALIVKDELYVGNVGDSQVVLCRGNNCVTFFKPHNVRENPEEQKRIILEGGIVTDTKRLAHPGYRNCSLALSRAIGDILYKDLKFTKGHPTGLSAEPDITSIKWVPEDKFLILACDGLWDVINHQEAVNIARLSLNSNGDDPQQTSEELVKMAYMKGSTDNITVLVVVFYRNHTSHKIVI